MFCRINFTYDAWIDFFFGYSKEEYLFDEYNRYFSCREYNEAIKILGQIISILPNKPEYYSYRAGIREELRDIEGAICDYTSAINISKENDEKQKYLV